jgi:hypothetical protein
MPFQRLRQEPLDRRTVLRCLAALGLAAPAAATLTGRGGSGDGQPRMRAGMSGSGMPDWMMGEGVMDGQMMPDMAVIHDLLVGHDKIRRRVDDIAGGIRSRTTSHGAGPAGTGAPPRASSCRADIVPGHSRDAEVAPFTPVASPGQDQLGPVGSGASVMSRDKTCPRFG